MITRRQFSKVAAAGVVATSLPQASMAAPSVKVPGVGGTGCKSQDELPHLARSSARLNTQRAIIVVGIGNFGCEVIEELRTQIPAYSNCTYLTVCGANAARQSDVKIVTGFTGNCDLAVTDMLLIRAALAESDVVVLVAGFGGASATNLTRWFARAAICPSTEVVAVVGMPMKLEGPLRVDAAKAGLKRLTSLVERVSIQDNEALVDGLGSDATLHDAITAMVSTAGETTVRVLASMGAC